MNTSVTWNIAGVGPQTRHVAEEAARRAGMRLEEWLDEAIEQAAEFDARPDENDGVEDWSGVVAHRFRRISHRERLARADDMRERNGDLIESTMERFERRIARSEKRAVRAFEAIARMLERSDAVRGRERRAWCETTQRAEAIDRSRQPEAAQDVETHGEAAAGTVGNPDSDHRFDERMDEIARRIAASPRLAREPGHVLEAAPARPRLDLKLAVSQIAMRRQHLDARDARASALAANSGGDGAELGEPSARSSADPADQAHPVDSERPSAPSDSLRDDVRALAAKLDEMRREQADQRVSAVDVNAMRVEMAAMTRSLADLAPRNAVVGLEGAIQDLTQRVAVLRENGHGEALLAPLDAVAAELRAALKAYDPQPIAAGLEREIRAIGGKIDGLAETAINPETFERIRRQTEEVRNLLAAAAMRSAPVERLERQIGELADRVERLGASPTPHVETLQMAASLEDVRREIERSTPLSALASIEQRLEQIAARLDLEIARPTAVIDSRPFEDLASRIDGVRQSLEARAQPHVETSGLEASLRELNAKLDRSTGGTDAGEIQSTLKEIAARIDRQPISVAAPIVDAARKFDSRPVEFDAEPLLGLMREISAKLDVADRGVSEVRVVDPTLVEISAKLDAIGAPTLARHIVERIVEQVARLLEDRLAGQVDAEVLAEQIANIHDRLDALAARAGRIAEDEPLTRELLERLRETSLPLTSSAAEIHAGLAADLAELRAEQANADRRTHSRLTGLQDILEKLVERLGNIESEISGEHVGDARSQAREGAMRRPPTSALPGVEALGDEATYEGPRRAAEAAARADRAKSSPKTAEDETSSPSLGGEDLLLEPGADAPRRTRDAGDLAQSIGTKTNPAVSAHIAAARRAAQAALAESAPGSARPTLITQRARFASRGVERAKSFYASHRRSVLLGVALLVVVAIAVRLGGTHAPFLQKSDKGGRPVRAATSDAPAGRPLEWAGATPTAGRPIDSTPTASIGLGSEPSGINTPEFSKADGAPPPELPAAIPAGISQTLRDAVVAGAPAAEYELAQRLFEGRGAPQDQQAAAQWYERAASLGLPPAQYKLAAIYEKGVGTPRDSAAAKRWYLKAAEAGNARAAHNLAVMNAESVGEKPDYAEAAKWFRKAGEWGVRDSQYNLAILYARGLGVGQDLRQSWMWFSLAAAQGDVDASKKRDEVAAKLDPASLAEATEALAKFKVVKPDPAANDVAAPPGGWDAKSAPPSASQSPPASGGGARSQPPL